MLINILHWLSIGIQFANVALDVVPPKVKPYVAGGIGVVQYVIHLLDAQAPSIGVTK